jgi:hypothetical protein
MISMTFPFVASVFGRIEPGAFFGAIGPLPA